MTIKIVFQSLFAVAATCLLCNTRVLAADDSEILCVKSASFLAPPEAQAPLHYAPDRDVTVLHLAMDITPDFTNRTIAGSAVLTFKPAAKPVQEIKLDAVRLTVESVTSSQAIQDYQVTDDKIIITFAKPIPADQETSVTIAWHCEPKLGIYFRTPEMGYKPGDTHMFSQGEEIEARNWYPCFDSPNEKFTSEITCHVPAGMTVVSNGKLLSEETNSATGMVAVHWSQEKPHANYLITLVAGYFEKLEAKHNDVPLAFLTPPSEFKDASNSFRETDEIMTFFEKEIGVPFPWAKYYQVCVNDFVAGGMENTSATTLTDSTLFRDETENIRNSQSLVSHEMAHQWFGDLVTCKEWSDIWLNEGFATYYQVLYNGFKNGRDAMLYDLYGNARRVLMAPNDTNAIVRRYYNDPFEMFGYLAYPKGGWVLHMLRSQLGEDLYRRCIKTYLERNKYGNVTTEDLRKVIEELSGRPYDRFFDQWVYHAHYPELDVQYSWDEISKLAKLSVRQEKPGENALLFDVEIPVRFKGKFGTIDRSIHLKELQEDFYFPLESAPKIVRLDPDYTILAKTSFKVPSPMLAAQLADQTDVMGRILAIEQLADRQDKDSVAKLKEALNTDVFYGVRAEAAKALRSNHTDNALSALLASTNQPDARARAAVATAIGGFYRDSALEFEKSNVETEKNPEIVALSIRAMGSYNAPAIHDLLIKFLNSDSFHQQLAVAAINAIQAQDDPVFIEPLLETLGRRQNDFTGRGIAEALDTLANIARNEDKKDAVRNYLVKQLASNRQSVRLAAIRGLGSLGDPKAIAVLQTYATASQETPERAPAEQAVTALRSSRKPVDDFKSLRKEVMDLEKSNRNLRNDLDDLKKKMEATQSASPTNSVAGKPKKSKPEK